MINNKKKNFIWKELCKNCDGFYKDANIVEFEGSMQDLFLH